ncbi:MAG TPA: hypothetical protein VMH01_15255 [Puia sp.]|nr:hypothetical protein [Puia sp.]
MSIEIARYQFHSWSRRGISANIIDDDDLGSNSNTQMERAEIAVGVTLNTAPLSKKFLLIGPGDIIGVNSNMIVRTEPLNGITNFEPNYLSFIEFYDEEFTWRYTPASPVGGTTPDAKNKLRPWLHLLVLKADEFVRTKDQTPLPAIQLNVKNVFPPMTESWLWSHMHSNADIPDSQLTDYEKFLLSLNQTMNADPDQLYSRLICARKLDPKTPYTAFVVPAFETGRLAGLNQDTSTTHAQMPSWDNNGAKGPLPVYYEWSFTTGENEDFESLVKLLQPQPMDPRVGIRDMDCSRPGFVRAEDPSQEIPGTSPQLIGLEGALKSPDTVSTVFPNPPASNDFQVELQKIANLPITITGTNTSGDPVISVPIYGSNHAKQSADDVVSLDITNNYWVNDLNKDPRTRVPAGFGTTIVQNNQSYLMPKAWAQVSAILQANKIIKSTVFMMKVALQMTVKTMSQLPQQVLMAVSNPVLSRVMGSPTTIAHQIRQSNIPAAIYSGAFRRLMRPRARIARRISPNGKLAFDDLVTGLNNNKLNIGPVNVLPAGLPNTQQISGEIGPTNLPLWLTFLLKYAIWILVILLVIFILLALITGRFALFGILAAAAVGGYFYLTNLKKNVTASQNLNDPQAELNSIAGIPPQPSFSLQLSSESSIPAPTPTTPGADSVEAVNFRKALPDIFQRMAIQVPVKPVVALDLGNAYTKVSTAIHPHTAFPLRLSYKIRFPNYISLTEPDKIFPAMAYPDIEDPMYKYLNAISQDLLLPNIKLVPNNCVSLVETNPKFIESYMVGLNHEMGRELLWNEYPTDERGSYFRQFWDVKGIIEPSSTLSEAQQTEAYKDIKPIDTWGVHTLLGSHNNRMPPGSTSPQAVLVIRGELLKRYPNTLIFAQKAIAGTNGGDPVIDLSLTDQTFPKEVKFPLYKADAPPDIKFFGFDLTIDQAKGTDLTDGFTDHLGWFFVIQEIPGEPRFGMDITYSPDSGGITWADLSWENFSDPNIAFITAGVVPAPPSGSFPATYSWGKDAANMASILFRKPSMVAIHASEMLDTLKQN